MNNQKFSPIKIASLTSFGLAMLTLISSYLYPFHLPPWATFFNEFSFAVFIFTALIYCILNGRFNLPTPWPWLAALALIILHYIFWQQGTPAQQDLFLQFLVFIIVGFSAYTLGLNGQGNAWFPLILCGIWLAATISTLIAITQWSGIAGSGNLHPGFILSVQGDQRAPSNIGQANNLGTLLVIGIWTVCYGWYSGLIRSTTWWRTLAILSITMLTFGVYISGSRAALLNLAVAPMLLGAWMVIRKPKPIGALAVLPIVLLTFFHFAVPEINNWLSPGDAEFSYARELTSDPARVRLWSMASTAVAEHPWLGHGFAAMANTHLRLAPDFGSFGGTVASHAHNTPLDLWMIFGLPLGSLLIGGFIWIWITSWVKSRIIHSQFIWLMTTAMIIHALVEYPLHYGFFFWLLCMLLGYLSGQPSHTLEIKKPILSALTLSVIFLSTAYPVWRGYVDTEALYTKARNGSLRPADLSEQPGSWSEVFYPGLKDRIQWSAKQVSQSTTPEELLSLEQTAYHYPDSGLIWRVAVVYAYQNQFDQSSWWLERLCSMYPNSCGRAEEAWMQLEKSNHDWPSMPWKDWIK